MAAPLGNQNAKKAKRWREAVSRALARATGENVDAGLDRAADIFVAACFGGDLSAIRDLADRFDGKPAQAIVGGEEDDPPLRVAASLDAVYGAIAALRASPEVGADQDQAG